MKRNKLGVVVGIIVGAIVLIGIAGSHTPPQRSQSLPIQSSSAQALGAQDTTPETAPNDTTSQAPAATAPAPAASASSAPNDSYTNTDGNTVPSPQPTPDNSIPTGATAQCRDGSYSFSQHHQGTCSHHGGVARWL